MIENLRLPVFLAVFTSLLPAQDVKVTPQAEYSFPALGVLSGESLRINVLNSLRLNPSLPTLAASCNVSVEFYDQEGKLLAEKTIDQLLPGTIRWVDYSPQITITVYPPPRIVVAPVVKVRSFYATPALPIDTRLPLTRCQVILSLELVDRQTNKTLLGWQGPVLSPPPIKITRATATGRDPGDLE